MIKNNLLLYCLIEVHGEWNLNVLNLRKKITSINLRGDRCVIYPGGRNPFKMYTYIKSSQCTL